MPWSRALETAAALDAAIADLVPDAPEVEPAARLAETLAHECADRGAPEVSELAATIGRALAFITAGKVEPHHTQWLMASAMTTARQALEHLQRGETYAPVALAGARYELETLFPGPETLVQLTAPRKRQT